MRSLIGGFAGVEPAQPPAIPPRSVENGDSRDLVEFLMDTYGLSERVAREAVEGFLRVHTNWDLHRALGAGHVWLLERYSSLHDNFGIPTGEEIRVAVFLAVISDPIEPGTRHYVPDLPRPTPVRPGNMPGPRHGTSRERNDFMVDRIREHYDLSFDVARAILQDFEVTYPGVNLEEALESTPGAFMLVKVSIQGLTSENRLVTRLVGSCLRRPGDLSGPSGMAMPASYLGLLGIDHGRHQDRAPTPRATLRASRTASYECLTCRSFSGSNFGGNYFHCGNHPFEAPEGSCPDRTLDPQKVAAADANKTSSPGQAQSLAPAFDWLNSSRLPR